MEVACPNLWKYKTQRRRHGFVPGSVVKILNGLSRQEFLSYHCKGLGGGGGTHVWDIGVSSLKQA